MKSAPSLALALSCLSAAIILTSCSHSGDSQLSGVPGASATGSAGQVPSDILPLQQAATKLINDAYKGDEKAYLADRDPHDTEGSPYVAICQELQGHGAIADIAFTSFREPVTPVAAPGDNDPEDAMTNGSVGGTVTLSDKTQVRFEIDEHEIKGHWVVFQFT